MLAILAISLLVSNSHGAYFSSNIFGNIIDFLKNLFASIFGQIQQTSSTTSIYNNSTTSTCPSINIGTYGSSSTGGNCTDFVVNIGTYGTYENYENACPSIVNIGTDGTYYNNATGCYPEVNIGTDAKYYNINTKSTSTIPNTSNITVPTTTISSPNCQTTVNIGTYGNGNTGGTCLNYTVNIGTYGTYTNYQYACPSVVNIGTYGVYYNNVTGCNPQVNIGTGARYYNVNVGSIPSTSIPTSTVSQYYNYTTTIQPTTTIYSSGSTSCVNFRLTENNPDSSASGSCTWSGGYLTFSENEGQFAGLNVSIIGNTGSSFYVPVYTYPSCETIQHQNEYLPAGTYEIYITSGSSGISCSNSYGYISIS